ncbi:MAG: MBL fold metallo-hydrolase [Bacteroidota bacterium]
MMIKCWGARGSIAVSGNEYVKYGGDTTCIEIRSKNNEIIIVDAGTGIRKLGNELVHEPGKIINLIFTHAHWDHLLGFPFFKPIYIGGITLKMFGCPFAQQSIKDLLSQSMSPPYFPVKWEDLSANITYEGLCDRTFMIDTIQISPIRLSHPKQGIGNKFTEDGRSFVFLTDNELSYSHPGSSRVYDYIDFCAGADLLIHDAEYTREEYTSTRSWGHSTYEDAMKLALHARVKQLGLFHHNQDRSDDNLDEIVNDCESIKASAKSDLTIFAVSAGMEITLG